MIRLSICIPTYNRSRCLAELLDSIVAQDDPRIEVIVSDDTSPDDTSSVAIRYQNRLHQFTFVRQSVNLGLDRNFLAVVASAQGDYVWLMGDDDRLEPGAIQAVLNALDTSSPLAGMTIGVVDYDPRMETVTGLRAMPSSRTLHSAAEVFGTIADLLGFMSALVIDRRLWQTVCEQEPIQDYMNYYVQVYIIGKVLERRPQWGVLDHICVGYRSDNDQFLSKFGWIKRLRMDVVAYTEIETALFANNRFAARRMRQRIFDTHVMARIVNAKSMQGPTQDLGSAIALLARHYTDLPKFWGLAIPLLLTPNAWIRWLRNIYQKHSTQSGRRRAIESRSTAR